MNADQLWQTTMDPKNRKIIQVSISDGLLAERMFKTLMGDDVEKRKLWIQENVKFTLEDDQIQIIEMEK